MKFEIKIILIIILGPDGDLGSNEIKMSKEKIIGGIIYNFFINK